MSLEVQNLQEYGITDIKVVMVLRGSDDTEKENLVGEAFTLPNELEDFVAMGNPPEFFAGYGMHKKYSYFTVFITKNAAIQFTAKGVATKNPIFLIDKLTQSLSEVLKHTDSTIPLNMNPQYPESLELLTEIKGLDALLYNLTINKKIIIIGDYKQSIQLLQILIAILPKQYQAKCTFALNITNPQLQFIGLDPSVIGDAEEQVESLIKQGYDIVDMTNKQAYGSFATDFMEKLAGEIKGGASIQNVQSILQALFDTALSDQAITEETIVNNWKLTLADNDFLQQIRQEKEKNA